LDQRKNTSIKMVDGRGRVKC